jgi:hypothetical protein
MVEATAKVVKNVSEQQHDWLGGNLVRARFEKEVRRVVYVGFTPVSVVVRLEPVIDFDLQLLQVMVRPPEF